MTAGTLAALAPYYEAAGLPRADLSPGGRPAGRPYLVFIRAGDSRSYRRWNVATSNRNWDLLVSLYGREAATRERDCEWVSVGGLGKWIAVEEVFALRPDLLDRYQAFFFPDDDVEISSRDIDRLFHIVTARGLALAQPALDSRSFASHPITLRRPFRALRYTNFVEIMAPAFDRDSLARCLPVMSASISGWGLDYVWPSLLGGRADRIAVVDAVAARHPRPVDTRGGAWYQFLRRLGVDAEAEMNELLRRFGVASAIRVERTVWNWSVHEFGAFASEAPRSSLRRLRRVVAARLRRDQPA